MLAALFNIDTLREPLASGDLIITANNRLRNHILRAFAAQQAQNVWQPPAIAPLNHWINDCWASLQDSAHPQTAVLIASSLQRQLLWEQIILASDSGQELLQAEELAKSADAALRNLQLWRLRTEQLNADGNLNTECFKNWLADFEQALKTRSLITAETAQEILLQAFNQGDLARNAQLYLQGFDDLPPLQRELLSAACDRLIELPATPIAEAQVARTEVLNDQAELRAAALWSQAQLQQNTDAVIGIIVPNLGQCRTQVERIFTEVFEPLAALPQTPRYTLPFNFSAGIPLATTALVQSALNLLNLNRKSWDLEPLCTLLQSPFFSDAENELVVRSLLCERLRKLGQFTISASDLHYHSQKICTRLGQTQSNNLAARILTLENDRRAINGQHNASYWINLFQRQLQQLGWPGTRRLDSQEYQQTKLWQQLLEEFCALDGANLLFDLNLALKHLRKLAGTTPFQAQTPDSPIQILGALEGAGLQFTHCWVMGLNHRQWPPAPAPNPLLPISLQRQHNMPHASAERELVFARALTENYRACAQHIVLSSAHSDGDNELRPSALIRDLPLTPLETLLAGNQIDTAQKNYIAIAASQLFELVHCASGPALAAHNTAVRGGSNLFKYQAACPFNAFAQLRLGARNIDAPVPGFSPMERGTILHNALAAVWRKLGNSQALLASSDDNLQALLTQAIAESIQPLQQKRLRELGSFYCQLEHERLLRLLTTWLNDEKTRPAFSVAAIEEEQTILFSGLTIRLRIDRIDQLENNDLLVIDYKTGSPKAKSWLGERPDEPQLPLYAVSHNQPVAAIAFAQINAKAMAWIGTGQLGVYHEGISPPIQDWDLQIDEWRTHLQRLAQDFIAGDARVDFKDKGAEQYAGDLLPLNRLTEAEQINALLLEQNIPLVGGNR
jgi:probable DNA repair protein